MERKIYQCKRNQVYMIMNAGINLISLCEAVYFLYAIPARIEQVTS